MIEDFSLQGIGYEGCEEWIQTMKIPNGKTVSMKEKITGDFVIQVVGILWEYLHRLVDGTFFFRRRHVSTE